MPTSVLCSSPIQGTILRVIKLDACGRPVTGTGSAQIVMDGFVQVQASPQYDTGDRKITRKANGTICVNHKIPDQFTNDEITIDFCVWHPGLLVNTIGARLVTGSSTPTGIGFAHGTWANASLAHWSLEVWGIADTATCNAAGTTLYNYWFWPHISDAKKGDYTLGMDPTQLQIIGNTYDASPLWTAGNSWLGEAVVLGDHEGMIVTSTAPPASACIIADYP
jgi:hypothetical protein